MNGLTMWKRQRIWRVLSVMAVLIVVLIATAHVSGQPAADLRVAVADCPPFVMRDARGELTGIAVDLWTRIAEELGITYQLEEYIWDEMLEKVETGEVDVAVSCITITAERESRFDFTHTFYEAYLTAATKKTNLLQSLKTIILAPKVLLILASVFSVSLLVGGGLWFLEHKQNEDIFPQRGPGGTIVEAFLCGFMLITQGTIHYTYWRTLLARVIFVIASFFSTLMVAAVTALLASALTAVTLQGQIQTPDDLRSVRVGAFDNTTSADYLHQNRISFTAISNDENSDYDLISLAQGKFDAVINDKPIFEYMLKQDVEVGQFKDIVILPWNLQTQNYGFALPEASPWREQINRVMLDILHTEEWQAVVDAYLKY
jgi:polar amino acid transport system substrate-binding protein